MYDFGTNVSVKFVYNVKRTKIDYFVLNVTVNSFVNHACQILF